MMANMSDLLDGNFIKLIIAPLQIGALSTASGFLDFQTLLGNHPNNEILRYTLIFLLSFSLKKIYPNRILIIGIIKYPKLASIILSDATA